MTCLTVELVNEEMCLKVRIVRLIFVDAVSYTVTHFTLLHVERMNL